MIAKAADGWLATVCAISLSPSQVALVAAWTTLEGMLTCKGTIGAYMSQLWTVLAS